ncbi:hypothetical protein PCASD_21451 [Puccinia coronata f. sp. avenae]|uniref:Uncharacterized protein n=1 Tax=Puccinia coronata f. sp. avenae TaxID=200324 RepID=A0A2N5S419_9BASI|nr:hypothetical protein PCASD_21451 [Puccinia coronata f. sp. avenae]
MACYVVYARLATTTDWSGTINHTSLADSWSRATHWTLGWKYIIINISHPQRKTRKQERPAFETQHTMSQYSATDPFSAIYKAQPGQLPSTLSIESYHHHQHADHYQGKPLVDHRLASPHPSSPRLPHEKYVFCPLLAGERDRVVRKRILSNPESLLPEPPTLTAKAPPLALAASASIHTHHCTTPKGGKDVTSSHQHHRSSTEPAPSSSSTNVDLSPYCNPLRRAGIFFSPPRHSDAKRIRSEHVGGSPYNTQNRTEHNSQVMMKRDSHARFSAAFSQAMVRGDACLDLDNQGLSTIPDLCQLVEEQKTAIGEHEESEKLVALISNMLEGGDTRDDSWQHHRGVAMKRAQSAPPPPVTKTTAGAASLFLSNNYLTSSLFANLHQICYFQGLEHLSLRANQLSEIPPEIGNLRNLKVLNLAHNLLQFLPASILKLTACKLFLVGNPWYKPPPASPLSAPSGNLAASARPVRQFRWLSQSRGVFYFSSPSARSLVPLDDDPLHSPIPSLLEACIRKMVITRDSDEAAEKIMGCDDDGLLDLERDIQRPSIITESVNPSSQGKVSLLPARVQQIIADPAAYFYRCDLCETRLVLKPGSLYVGVSSAQDPPPSPQHVFQFRSQNALFESPPPSLAPTDNINLDHSLIPIRWNICTLNCCVKHLIHI